MLLELAAELEVERDHALDRPRPRDEDPQWTPEDGLLAAANREEKASGRARRPGFEALEAQATFDRVLFDSQEFGTEAEVGSEEELDFLGIPGLLEPDQVTTLLRQRQAEQLAARSKRAPAKDVGRRRPGRRAPRGHGAAQGAAQPRRRVGAADLAAARHRARGAAAGCGGPEVPKASADQLRARIETLRAWFVGKK